MTEYLLTDSDRKDIREFLEWQPEIPRREAFVEQARERYLAKRDDGRKTSWSGVSRAIGRLDQARYEVGWRRDFIQKHIADRLGLASVEDVLTLFEREVKHHEEQRAAWREILEFERRRKELQHEL